MANKQAKKESRSRTPTEKKKSKNSELHSSPVVEDAEPTTRNVLSGDEIQTLAIKIEDLEKVRPPRPVKVQNTYPATNQVLVRKYDDKVEKKKGDLLVAHPQCPESPTRDFVYSEMDIPLHDVQSEILPHNILGTLQNLKQEATIRGNSQVVQLIADSMNTAAATLPFESKFEKRQPQQKKTTVCDLPKQDLALNNWQRHMTLRKQQQDNLSRQLGKPHGQLIMNTGEEFRKVQEEKQLIYRSIPAVDLNKNHYIGSEFWNVPEKIGDELSGLIMTLTQCERGYPLPVIHIGKPKSIMQETGHLDRPLFHNTWDKSQYLQYRRHELRAIMEELNFSKPEIEGLEVIGRGNCFTSMSSDFLLDTNETADISLKENKDMLKDFPNVIPDVVLGPSLLFCGQPANWIEDMLSHRDKVGICVRITFETLAGDKASAAIEIVNNGSAAIWYEWRRLPSNSSLERHHKESHVQRFYFNACAGVILPGKTLLLPFHFKSSTAGIFMENWELCTHPVLLAGAMLQVSLWGVALYEDKTSAVREALENELLAQESVLVAQELVRELLNGVRTPERPQSPLTCVTEEEKFHLVNPKLYYKQQTVQELHQLWKDCIATLDSENQNHENFEHEMPLESTTLHRGIEGTQGSQAENVKTDSAWNLSVMEIKQTLRSVQKDETKEMLLLQLNNHVTQSSSQPQEVTVDLVYQACLQLWRKGIDDMVERSLLLRMLMEMPEKDLATEFAVEEAAFEQKNMKGSKEEKKGGKTGSRDRADEPSNNRKGKGKEEKKSMKPLGISQENDLSMSSGENLDLMSPASQSLQVDPAVKEKYYEGLHTEVYGILLSLVQDMVIIAESLTPRRSVMEHEFMDQTL
ncbi:Hypothetical predicted protein [Pelobates cultripes]|uniref:MYCBP-associated protein n=1 Tax=Pelobates cultripes TaxID=61616 RepID=A0AAD1SI98_PELCU|nr:Hypothetical predicted protein [Pelobates cultripes]